MPAILFPPGVITKLLKPAKCLQELFLEKAGLKIGYIYSPISGWPQSTLCLSLPKLANSIPSSLLLLSVARYPEVFIPRPTSSLPVGRTSIMYNKLPLYSKLVLDILYNVSLVSPNHNLQLGQDYKFIKESLIV